MTTIATIAKGRYSCPACSRRFTTLHFKKEHLRTAHPRKDKR